MKRHRSLTHSAFTPNTRAVPSFSGFFFESHHQCVQIIFTRQPDCASIDQNRDNQTVFTSVGSLRQPIQLCLRQKYIMQALDQSIVWKIDA